QEYEAHKGEKEGFGRLPDLILLDGGKGQVHAVCPVLKQFGLQIPLFGMVKDNNHRTRAITGDGGEIAINSHRAAFTLVSSIQDEVHRWAIGYHRQSRRKHTFSSSLTQIEGVGEKRAKSLLHHFRTVSAIREATLEELEGAPDMTHPAAAKVFAYFHENQE
ncbi:MAG TPA: excinuclease ABC subunit UvrC, partial [Ruminococcaceae bacterium]|nr:excinuclease ABC subunit UvrC [Oscillospiraceae bacterium]